jgi:hypothetical protein
MQRSKAQTGHASLPLSALLSQVLVAFTIELDNEFERRMGESGYLSTGLSWSIWANLIRFVGAGISVRELGEKTFADTHVVGLGCLERWRYVVLQPDSDSDNTRPIHVGRLGRRGAQRDGWGSGRGIRNEWIVRLTEKGQKAGEIWPTLFPEIEQGWQKRFGAEQIRNLRQQLQEIASQIDLELPHALPPDSPEPQEYAPRTIQKTEDLSLLTLLSQVLLAFAIEFDRESKAPLALSANVLRVLGNGPVRIADLPGLTGGSPERTDIGWRLKPYVSVAPDPRASRGKIASLTRLGRQCEETYHRLTAEIEQRWRSRFGKSAISELRKSILQLFERREEQNLMAQGLIPPAGVARAGAAVAALGRRKVAPAAVKRVRDLVAQTKMFVNDPAATLPHYPLWDMNRGFGP